MRKETKNIVDNYYMKKEKMLFLKFAEIIDNNIKDIEKHKIIWEYDQKLGGLGGYAAPLNVIINPFKTYGDYRNVFRSLQYSRNGMFLHARPRFIIIDAALSLETLVKLLLSKNTFLKYSANKKELGKNVEELHNRKIIDEDFYKRLNIWKKILNYAKHDTDPECDYTFDYEDAVIFYFKTRVLGNKILKILNHYTSGKFYKIKID